MASPASAAASNASQGSARGAAACIVCRFRKVRCDRTSPSCLSCQRLGVVCPGLNASTETLTRADIRKSAQAIFDASGIEKRRFGSCDECRLAKSRCCRSQPSCARCLSKGLHCIYPPSKAAREPARSLAPAQPSLPPQQRPQHEEEPSPTVMSDVSSRNAGTGSDPLFDAVYGGGISPDTLPDNDALVFRLVTAYFDRIHPLRAYSFIHKPTFLRALGRGTVIQDYGRPLLQVMCALGARVLYMDARFSDQPDSRPLSAMPGDNWAEAARGQIMPEIHLPTFQKIMTTILLCEYALRTDQYALAFVLSSCAFRAIQLLGHSSPTATSQRRETTAVCPAGLLQETWNRLVWASYSLDVFLASGVHLNSSWQNQPPAVPLPSSHRDFLAGAPAPLYRLHRDVGSEDPALFGQLELPALMILLIRLRASVLQLIRCAEPDDKTLWDSSSSFMRLIAQLDAFNENLSDKYRISDLNIYVHRDEHVLGAVFSLHFLYHAVAFDLTRISLAGFTFPLARAFHDAPASFRLQCQQRCNFHASELSDLSGKGLTHAPTAFDDSFCPEAIFEATKILIIYSATVANDAQSIPAAKDKVRTNLRALSVLHTDKAQDNPYIRFIEPLCAHFGFGDVLDEWRRSMGDEEPGRTPVEITGSADLDHLVRFAPFRKAISQLQAKQRDQDEVSASSPSERPADVPGRPRPPMVVPTASASETSQQVHPPPSLEYVGFEPPPQQQQAAVLHGLGNAPVFGHDAQHAALPLEYEDSRVPSAEDYVRTADQLSGYITWDLSEFFNMPTRQDPEWMDVTGI